MQLFKEYLLLLNISETHTNKDFDFYKQYLSQFDIEENEI